jgi:branched-chain amino acid transport system substrate-binding protein
MKDDCLKAGQWGLLFAVLLLGLPSMHAYAQGAKEPIRIGFDVEMTGVMSEASMNVKMGYDLYLQEVGYRVAGQPMKPIEYDNKTDPKISMEVAQKLVEKDNVHMICFGTNSSSAIAVRGYAEKVKVPMVVVGMAGSERVTLPPSKYIFRMSYADGQLEIPLARYAYENLGYRRMAMMGPDYAGSTGKLWAFQQEFEKSGGKIVQTIFWPLGEMDLAPYFGRLRPEVEAIFPFEPGDISINRFLSQYFELGMDKKMKLCAHFTFTEDYLTIQTFKEKMLGMISGGYYCLDFNTPENKRVTEKYYAKYGKKKLMNSQVATGYDAMKFICTALEAIGGNVEDTEAFLKAMHSVKMRGIAGSPVSVDANGNVVRDIIIRQVQKKDGEVKNVVLNVIPQVLQPPQGFTLMPRK